MSLLQLSGRAGRNFRIIARQASLLSVGPPSCFLVPQEISPNQAKQLNHALQHMRIDHRQYSSSSNSSATRWIMRRVYAVLALLGLSGGALILVGVVGICLFVCLFVFIVTSACMYAS